MSKLVDDVAYYVNPNIPPFVETFIVTLLCPLIWNSIARLLRYLTHDVFPSTPRWARYLLCAAMTLWIFFFSMLRDFLFHRTLSSQPTSPLLQSLHLFTHPLALVLLAVGQLFVLSSFWALGWTGTYLGDYVGILMDAPVRSFPFNVLDNPMYVGSSMCFLGSALWNDSWAGVVLTGWVYVVYLIALQFEEPYTVMIYSQRETQRREGKKVQ